MISALRASSLEMRVATVGTVSGAVVFVAIIIFLCLPRSNNAINPPLRLSADAQQDGTVLLTWSPLLFGSSSLGAWQYQCAKEQEQFGDWQKAVGRESARHFDVDSCGEEKLAAGVPHKFRVRAVHRGATGQEAKQLGRVSNEARATPQSKVDPVVVWLRKLYKALNHTASELAKILGENADASKQNLVDIKGILEKIEAAIREGKVPPGGDPAAEVPTVAQSCDRKYFNDLYFGYDSWVFPEDSQSTDCNACRSNEVAIANIVKGLEDSKGEILVEGYASPPGSYGYNLDLAHRRALYVIDRLLDQNEDWRARFKPIARGEGYLPDPARFDEGYQAVRVSICSDEPQAPAASGQGAGRTAATARPAAAATAPGARRGFTV